MIDKKYYILKLFAFSKMNRSAFELLENLKKVLDDE